MFSCANYPAGQTSWSTHWTRIMRDRLASIDQYPVTVQVHGPSHPQGKGMDE